MLQSADYLGDVQGAGAVLEDEAGNAQTAVLLGVVKDGVIFPDCQELLEIGEGGGDVLEGHINALGHELVDGIQGIGAEMASINSYFHVCDLLDVWVDCFRWFQYNRDLLICKIELLYR